MLQSVLRDPQRILALTARDWDLVIPQARGSGLLSRLASIAEARGEFSAIPERQRHHLVAAKLLAEKHQRDVVYELDRVREILGQLLGTIVLLKGAAYLASGLPPSAGRVFNDIDLLVPLEKLDAVEALLDIAGWRLGEIDPYDDSYYRRWMHQIPPLTHTGRQTTLDVHHSIVPRTARVGHASAAELYQRIRPIEGRPGFAVLAPEDMVLHSATHLFNEGEFHRGLRDLNDLDLLLRHFGATAGYWPVLLDRAAELGLSRPLFYALRWTRRVFDTPMPDEVIEASRRFKPPAPALALMEAALGRALSPNHKSGRDGLTGPALLLLYIRAHYLRMPLHILVPHLLRKAVRPEPAP